MDNARAGSRDLDRRSRDEETVEAGWLEVIARVEELLSRPPHARPPRIAPPSVRPLELRPAMVDLLEAESAYADALQAADEAGRLAQIAERAFLERRDRVREIIAARTTPPDIRPEASREPASDELPPLSIRLLGGFEVRRGGVPIPLCPNRNGQTILRYLATRARHSETLDVLMDLLWPDDPPQVARHKLHVAFSALRQSLHLGLNARSGGYVVYEGGAYSLDPSLPVETDAHRLLALYARGRRAGGVAAVRYFEAACRLHVGVLLPHDLYADWTVTLREEVEHAHREMSLALAEHELAAGRPDDAAAWADAALADNPTDERSLRMTMRCLAEADRRADALRRYERTAAALRDELGLAPSDETEALRQAIAQAAAFPAPGDDAGPAT